MRKCDFLSAAPDRLAIVAGAPDAVSVAPEETHRKATMAGEGGLLAAVAKMDSKTMMGFIIAFVIASVISTRIGVRVAHTSELPERAYTFSFRSRP